MKRPIILVAVMLAMFASAVEATIVSTAMPSIANDLGSFSQYSWVFSAYLLTSTVTVLLYGKLSDLFGRKLIFTIGMSLFLLGSLLCGMAESMTALIVFRFIQGIGAGAVMPITTTIIGDIYSPEERAKIQGYLSSVWGISAVAGPAIGGVLVATIGWEYVFWVNIPLGLLSLAGIWLFLKEPENTKTPSVDYKGTAMLMLTIGLAVYLLVEGGLAFPWVSVQTAVIIAAIALFGVLFFAAEKRAVDPVVSIEVWKNPTILFANLVSFVTGMILIGISSYLPSYVTGVMEQPAIIAGFTLTTMSIGWPIASVVAGKLLLTIGNFKTSFVGCCFLLLGTVMFVFMTSELGPGWAAASSFSVGVGMGLTTTAFIVSIQAAVSHQQRGAATASNVFMRNLGSTFGVAILGGILNNSLIRYFADSGETLDSVNGLLTADGRIEMGTDRLLYLQEGLSAAVQNIYIITAIAAVVALLLVFGLPKKKEVGTHGN